SPAVSSLHRHQILTSLLKRVIHPPRSGWNLVQSRRVLLDTRSSTLLATARLAPVSCTFLLVGIITQGAASSPICTGGDMTVSRYSSASLGSWLFWTIWALVRTTTAPDFGLAKATSTPFAASSATLFQ